jgi:hypothetical protein
MKEQKVVKVEIRQNTLGLGRVQEPVAEQDGRLVSSRQRNPRHKE